MKSSPRSLNVLAALLVALACVPQGGDSLSRASEAAPSSPAAEGLEAQSSRSRKGRTGIGKFCGGIAGLACPEGLDCVDDPRDDCNPHLSGADCGGICVMPRGASQCERGPGVRYVSRDPNQCAAILFFCEPGSEPFFGECGCGCRPVACDYNDPSRTFISTDAETCALIRFTCEEGKVPFSDACGCGCQTAP